MGIRNSGFGFVVGKGFARFGWYMIVFCLVEKIVALCIISQPIGSDRLYILIRRCSSEV